MSRCWPGWGRVILTRPSPWCGAVVGAAALLVRGRGPARSVARSPGATVAAAVVVGALALVGVLSQAGAIGSSPGGSDRTGGGGVNGPYAPGGGGGTPGGGS